MINNPDARVCNRHNNYMFKISVTFISDYNFLMDEVNFNISLNHAKRNVSRFADEK